MSKMHTIETKPVGTSICAPLSINSVNKLERSIG
jgi:hypothetical protein